MDCSKRLTRRRRGASSALVLLLFVATLTPARAQEEPSAWRASVAALLAERSRAVRAGDRSAFAATQTFGSDAFKRARSRWFDRLRTLPLSAYDLTLDDDTYEDLIVGASSSVEADEQHLVTVRERIAFGRSDTAPTDEPLFLTVARRGSTWSVVGDSGVAGLGLASVRNIWDFGSVRTANSGRVLVITRGSRSQASRIARETSAAVRRVRSAWPLSWDGRVVLVIPATAKELSSILRVTFDLGPFVAFASASVHREDGGWSLVGNRVYVQPATYFGTSTTFQQDTLGHELLHVATRKDSGPYVPSWLEEGVAQIFGERAPPPVPEFALRVRRGSWDGHVPTESDFTSRSTSDIQAAYQASADIVRYMRQRFGRAAVGRFYRRLGDARPDDIGTRAYHLDVASRTAFDRSFRSLERAWATEARRRFR